jgi:hypothetical protein
MILKNLASIFSSRVAAAYLFGFFGHLFSAHQTMVLESYFDDSSDSRRSNLYACGGLLGGPGQWDRFDILWNNETHALKEPFRSVDCEGQCACRSSECGTILYFILWNEVALEYLAQNGGPENLELLSSWDTLPAAPRLFRYIYQSHCGYVPS